MSLKKYSLPIILATVFLDMVGYGIIMPSLPFIIRSFGLSEQWVGITFAMFSLGMFLGGIFFGRLSDVYGRKRILAVTSFLNMLGYVTFAYSGNIWVFMAARFLSGLGGAGMAIGQAYVSDISAAWDRTKNLGLTGAMFWLGFTVGPVLGGVLGGNSHLVLGLIAGAVIFLNLLVILFFLPEIHKKHFEAKEESASPLDFHHHKKQIYLLFAVAFIAALGFSAMQTTFSLILADRFSFNEKLVGYSLGFVGIVSIVYQWFLVRYTRKFLNEKGMILFWLIILAVSFALFAFNPFPFGVLPLIAFFPIGYGSINPAISSLHAHYAGKEAGKALGTNTSMMSLGNITWPFIAGYLYVFWNGAPYVGSSVFFLIAFVLVLWGLRRVKKG